MDQHLEHFLIVFDTTTNRIARLETYDDLARAVEAYGRTEAEYFDRPEIHVVQISSDSIDTVKRTHGLYWGQGSLDDAVVEVLDTLRRGDHSVTGAK